MACVVLGAMVLAGVSASMPAAAATSQTYIVVLDDSVPDPAAHAAAHGHAPTSVWTHALKGYAAPMAETVASALASAPGVRSVHPNGVVTKAVTQSPATWGLDRIDQRLLPLNNSYTYNSDGTGVRAYIIDTGVLLTHSDFGGRAVSGYDFVDDDSDATDCEGHGTHVAGTVGSATYGVAKGVTIVAVRVLDCNGSGTWRDVIDGIDWVTADHDPGERAVANMSLGGGCQFVGCSGDPVVAAVTGSIADGVTYAISAGNSNANACNVSPAATPNALTVGSTTSTDARSSFSNIGTCLDLFAPGSGITSTYNNCSTCTTVLSGTSMAAPHVAGAAALLLDANPSWTPSQVRSAITGTATTGVVGNPGTGSPNRLLYTGNAPTIAGFTPTSGPVGTLVTITGTNFTGATNVAFNIAGASFTVVNSTTITATVPGGATTGHIRVTTPGGTASSSGNFTVTGGGAPTITSFTPTSGPVGTVVTITGTNFNGATAVRFNQTSASFTILSPTQIRATVPTGATNGHIRVTTPAGTASSTGNFIVTP